MKRTVATLTAIAFLAGCATASKDIASTYVSPVMYQAYDCQQIAAETARLETRVTQLGGRLDQAASNDKAIAGVGIVLFWPALFALGGNKAQEAEFATLKGQADALSTASIEKKCGMAKPTTVAAAP